MTEVGPLAGRVALVTGGGRGIGRAVALSLSDAGAAVAVNDIDAAPADEVTAEITARGGVALSAPAPIDDPTAVADLLEVIETTLGAVDTLVSSAGIPSSGLPVHCTDPDEVVRLFEVHALGPFALCRAVLPRMRERRFGRIVFISSSATEASPPNSAPYTMAKAAVEGLARTIANEGERHGVTANVVAPGFVDTRLGQLVMGRMVEKLGDAAALVPMPAMLAPTDVAASVLHLVGATGHALNGQRLRVGLLGPAPDPPTLERTRR